MIELKDQRCSFRCSNDFLDEMASRANHTPLSVSSFIIEAAKIGAPILENRFTGGAGNDKELQNEL